MSLVNPGDCSIDRGQGAGVRSDRLTIGKSPPRLGIGSVRDPNSGIFSAGASMDGRPPPPNEELLGRQQYLPPAPDRDFQLIHQTVAHRRMASPPPTPGMPPDDAVRGKLEVLTQENARLQNAHVGLINQANSLQSQLSKALTQANLYSSSVGQLERIISDLEKQHAAQSNKSAQLNDKVSELTTWNTVLKSDLQSARRDREKAITEACEFYQQLVSSQKDLASMSSRLAAVERGNRDLHSRVASTDVSQSLSVSAMAEEVKNKNEQLHRVSAERERLNKELTESQIQRDSAVAQRDSLKARIDQLIEDMNRKQKEAEHRSQLSSIELSDAQKSFYFVNHELSQLQPKQRELEAERNQLAMQLRATSQQLALVEEERKRLSAELGLSTNLKREDEEAKERYLIDLEICKKQIHSLEEEKQQLHDQIAHLFDVNRNLQALSIEGSNTIKKLKEDNELKIGQLNLRLAAKDAEIISLAEDLLKSRIQLEENKRELEEIKPNNIECQQLSDSMLHTQPVDGKAADGNFER